MSAVVTKVPSSKISKPVRDPTPLEFDKFIPWVCLQYVVDCEVSVTKNCVDKYSLRRSKQSQNLLTAVSSKSHKQTEEIKEACVYSVDLLHKINITAYYDNSGHLVEVAVLNATCEIDCKVIKAISMCAPFHPALYKITIRSGLTSIILREVAKLLFHSHLTDVCLDDSCIPAGNYYMLLDNVSSLKVLSLKSCKISDVTCKEIADRIDMGKPSILTVLDLGTNDITDTGVKYLGEVLRRNRTLRHLGLSNNKITDDGFMHIMNHLKEFPLSVEELTGRRMRRLDFFKQKESEKSMNVSKIVINQETQTVSKKKTKHVKKKKQSIQLVNKAVEKEDFIDVFDNNNVVIRDGYVYCIGNFNLCSLNLAYNELDYFSIKRVVEVLQYQISIRSRSNRTGLLRLVLDGNFIPDCDELADINSLLPSLLPSNLSFHSSKSRSKKLFNN